jgi:hypothetical protein
MKIMTKIEDAYLKSVAILLFLAGAAKLISASQKLAVLTMPDPLIGFLSVRQIDNIVGVLEVVLAGYIFTPRKVLFQLGLVAWLSVLFIIYRIGLTLVGFRGMCPCLGNASSWLKTSDASINNIAKIMLAYFFVGSVCLIGNQMALLFGKTSTKSV